MWIFCGLFKKGEGPFVHLLLHLGRFLSTIFTEPIFSDGWGNCRHVPVGWK